MKFFSLLAKLWDDDCGAVLAVEWTILTGVATMGTMAGAVAVRDAVNANMQQTANVVRQLAPQATFSGWANPSASVPGLATPPAPQWQFSHPSQPQIIVQQVVAAPGLIPPAP